MKKGKVITIDETTGYWVKAKDQRLKKGLNFIAMTGAKEEEVFYIKVIRI